MHINIVTEDILWIKHDLFINMSPLMKLNNTIHILYHQYINWRLE